MLLSEHDIIGIQESKLDDADMVTVQNFELYTKNRKEISRHRSGGIALLVRDKYTSFIRILKNDSKLVLWFTISKEILPIQEDLICGVVYIPPIGSKYANPDPYLEIQNEFDKFCLNSRYVLLFGDYNSRTGNMVDFIECDKFISDLLGDASFQAEREEIFQNFEKANLPLQRNNADSSTNAYGYQLVDFCKNNNIFVLNGRFDSSNPRLTCKNSSVVDYVLSTAHNFELITFFKIHEFDSLYSDAHCPISFNLAFTNRNDLRYKEIPNTNDPKVRLWNIDKKDDFCKNLNYGEVLKISTALDLMATSYDVTLENVNTIVTQIESIFLSASEATFGTVTPTKCGLRENNSQRSKMKPWFNHECQEARNVYHNIRKLYNRYKTVHFKNLLKHVSKTYKQVISKNVKKHKNNKITKLRNLKNAKPRDYWKIINSFNNENKSQAALDDFYTYFKTINASSTLDEEDEPDDNINEFNQNFNEYINRAFSVSEITESVKNLKNNKSGGIDKILNEHLKISIQVMAPIYVKLFNIIFNAGLVPESWSLGEILPIYKKGNAKLPENYRPITLLSCFGKLFTSILNNRITKFLEDYDIINSTQAGFRKGFSTIDNIFIIQSLIEIAKVNKTKLFCAFIDFKQAFDTVWRTGLWQKLLNTNINGKCFQFIKNMYNGIRSRISNSEGTSAFFPCQNGVRQGENLSPLLFSIYLNDLEDYLRDNYAPGVECEANDENIFAYIKLFLLLFADDTVIFGNSKDDLQTALNAFEKYCDKWKLHVNTAKTKIMVFSGGRLPSNLHFYFKQTEIEIVSEYKYLGIYLARSGSFLKAKKHIAEQANAALFSLLRKIRNLFLPLDMQIDLFNKTIKPILLYGCELWGFGDIDILERVQLKFFKHILHLKKSTPSYMIYGETGTYPLIVDIQSRIISYWAKLNCYRRNNTAYTIYVIMHSLNEQRKLKTKWLDNIRNIICTNGYQNVWESQHNFNVKWFINSFKQKLKDEYLQNWNSLVQKSSSGLNYRIFKDTFEMNPFFRYLPVNKCRLLTSFRTRNHRLPIEVGRWTSTPINERLCRLCSKCVGDELHYVLECENLKSLRKEYIKAYYWRNPNTLKFNSLMNSRNKKTVMNLIQFISIILKIDKDATDNA